MNRPFAERGPDARMDKLAYRLSEFLKGESMLDIAPVCALAVVHCLNESFDDRISRKRAFNELLKFMREHLNATSSAT